MALKSINSGELLLHVGLHKTGTTALQAALAAARDDLSARGIAYPGEGEFQHSAVLAGAGRTFGWQDESAPPVSRQKWDDLVAGARGTAVISSEFFDNLEVETATRMINELGGPARVRVVVTLRPIGAILPSSWQQRLKYGSSRGYATFLKQMLGARDSRAKQRFWFRNDQVAQVSRWAGIVGPERVYAVIIPEGDRTAIFTAFEGLLGLPEGFLSERQVAKQNRSMTAAETELVRRVNKAVVDKMTWDTYERLVRRGLILSMVERRAPAAEEDRIQTPQWAAERAQALGERFAQGVAESGVHVIGDPAALATAPRSGPIPRPDSVPVDAAVDALVGVLGRAQSLSSEPALPGRRDAVRALLKPRRFQGK